MATVELKDLCKTYEGDVEAVKNASISIKDGEFLVLVGPSGCGKSTLLRMVAGLESITSGTITIGESVVNGIPAKDRNIAMVFQNYALYPHMTVYQNMAFGLRLRKVNKKEIEERVLYAAKLLDMMDYLSRKPKALSGGQAQRVAVGRAIVARCGNGCSVSAVSAFRQHPSEPFSARSVQSCLIGGLTTIDGPKGWRAMPFGLEVFVTLV